MVGALFWLNGLRGRAEVFAAFRSQPGVVALSVGSCNQNPFVAELEETQPGTYEVLVRTELPGNGDDCADGVTIDVDPGLSTITILDRTSGEVFNVLGNGEGGPAGLNGTWRMVTVADGEPVEVGVTTEQIPEITITADASTGVISGNFGCNDFSIDVAFDGDTIIGQPESLEGTEELCAIPDGSNQPVLTEQTLLNLLSGEPAEFFVQGASMEIGTLATNAVFELVG